MKHEETVYYEQCEIVKCGAAIVFETICTRSQPSQPLEVWPKETVAKVLATGEVRVGPDRWTETFGFVLTQNDAEALAVAIRLIGQFVDNQREFPRHKRVISQDVNDWLRVGFERNSTEFGTFAEFRSGDTVLRSDFENMQSLWNFHGSISAAYGCVYTA